MLPTYSSFPDQVSTLTLVPAIGKNGPLEIPGPPRSSSSDSSCALLLELVDGRMRGGTIEMLAVEGLDVAGVEFDADVEGEV